MDLIAYRIPVNEMRPLLAGEELVGYGENYYISNVPDINLIPSVTLDKYGIRLAPQYVATGINFYISTKDSAKLFKTYSSASEQEFFDEEFDKQRGIRIQRPMTDDEVTARYQTIQWLRIQQLEDYYQQKFNSLDVNKTPQERATWQQQITEAQAYIADNTVSTPTLTALATARNQTVADLANQIISAFNNYNNTITGLYAEQETYVTQLKNAQGDDIINVRLPFDTTVIPGDSRFLEQTQPSSGS
jgi:hypothetical protein